jgi:hypothetical protein
MLKQHFGLSSKIKVSTENDKYGFSKHYGFYSNYSLFILKVLKKSSFQKFLCTMFLAESIEEKIVNTIDIKVFPVPRKNGFNIVGKCDPYRGKIRIYPKTYNYCYAFRKKYGKDFFFRFVGNRARAALIHELLHIKYVSNEKKVQELTASYFSEYLKKQLVKNSNSVSLQNLIFASKKHTPFAGITNNDQPILP